MDVCLYACVGVRVCRHSNIINMCDVHVFLSLFIIASALQVLSSKYAVTMDMVS